MPQLFTSNNEYTQVMSTHKVGAQIAQLGERRTSSQGRGFDNYPGRGEQDTSSPLLSTGHPKMTEKLLKGRKALNKTNKLSIFGD